MKIREAINEDCKECGRYKRTIQEESYGCDGCKKPIDDRLHNRDNKHRHYLEVRVFMEDGRGETETLQFCSWRCVLKTLPKIKCDYFITLPYLTFDNLEKGIRAKDFFAAVKRR